MSTAKLELAIPRESNGPLSKFGKEFHLFLIVIFSLFTILGKFSKFAYFTTYGIVI